MPPRPKRTRRVGVPAGLEAWKGTSWKPAGNMIYPPPASGDVQRRPLLGLAVFAEANPEEPHALPRSVVQRTLAGECNYLMLAQRVDHARAYGLMRCSPECSQIPAIVGATDNWQAGEKQSCLGAKVYVQVPLVHSKCRDAALARVSGLLPEEDFDRCPWLRVNLGKEAAGIAAAPLEPWACWRRQHLCSTSKNMGWSRWG